MTVITQNKQMSYFHCGPISLVMKVSGAADTQTWQKIDNPHLMQSND